KREDRIANFYLAAYFWCFGLSVMISLAVVFGYVHSYPHVYRLSFFPGALIMPFAFLYLRRKLYATKPSLFDLLHFLPFFLYLIDYFPFLLLSGSEKLQIYLQEAKDPIRIKLAYSEGWFMPDFGHVVLRYILFFGYWIAQVWILLKAMQNPNHPFNYQEKVQKNWLQIFVGSLFLAIITPLLALWLGEGQTLSNWINVAAFAASLIQVYYLVFHPEVLYSLDTAYITPKKLPLDASSLPLFEVSSDESLAISEYEDPILTIQSSKRPASEDTLDQIQQVVEAFMHSMKPFTKPRFSIRDLSENTSIPVYRLSQYINQRYQINFYGYINQFRIEYFLSKIEAKEHDLKTLDALSSECGFQSRATFVRAFKFKTGLTPSEFISRLA
ncbi:MAG TPA: AraC family transcriptional regulator, partial [Sediminibacterium sp.]|nr:AraC family transcriptional regulator [Sediminibacterium sp.]